MAVEAFAFVSANHQCAVAQRSTFRIEAECGFDLGARGDAFPAVCRLVGRESGRPAWMGKASGYEDQGGVPAQNLERLHDGGLQWRKRRNMPSQKHAAKPHVAIHFPNEMTPGPQIGAERLLRIKLVRTHRLQGVNPHGMGAAPGLAPGSSRGSNRV